MFDMIANDNILGTFGINNISSIGDGGATSSNNDSSTIKPDLFYAQFRDQSRFWVQRVAVPMIMVIGLFGNLITVIIMTRRRMRSTTNMYLAALAFVDILYLLLTFLLGLLHYPNMDDSKYYYYWQLTPFLMMLTDACSNTSVWLTVTFTVERFIAVRYPMKGKIWCTEQRARKNIIGVFIFGFLAASPVPFEWQIAEKQVIVPTTTMKAQLDNTFPMIIGGLSENVVGRLKTNDVAAATTEEYKNSSVTMINDYYDSTTPTRTTNHYQNSADNDKVQAINDNIDINNNSSNDDGTDQSYDVIRVQATTPAATTGQIATTKTRLTLDYSELGRNKNYRRVYYQLTAILFTFIPLLSLMLFNGFLIKSVHESQRERERMTGTKGGGGGSTSTCNNIHKTSGEHLATNATADDISDKSGSVKNSPNHHQVIGISTENNNNNNNNTSIKVNGSTTKSIKTTTVQVDQFNNCDNKSRSPQSSSTTFNLPSSDSSNLKLILPQTNHKQPSILKRGASILKHSPSSISNANNNNNLQHHSSSQERRITIMLIAVVILFLVCQIPTAAMLLYRSVHDVIPNTNEDALLLAFGNIFNFLMATNAAGNFILYSFLSKKYRKTFLLIFCNCLKRGSELTTTATSSSISAKKLTNTPTTPTLANNHNRNVLSTAV